MAIYQVRTQNGTLVDIPDNAEVEIQGLRIIGDNKTDWNEPYNQNFLTLSNEVKDLEATVAGLGSGGVDLSGYYLKTEIGTVAEFTTALE